MILSEIEFDFGVMRQIKETMMAGGSIPHVQNDAGHPAIEIGVREFMCTGANPPFDHPHVFLDMGSDNDIVCPYCSTLFRYRPQLKPREARPAECLYENQAGTAFDLDGARGSGLR
jgi:uncharacterized Zn-finger protein